MRSLLAGVALLLSCSSTPMAKPDCEALGHRCHAAGESPNATATQRECHDKAHDEWTNAQCLDNKARCEAACPESHAHDAG